MIIRRLALWACCAVLVLYAIRHPDAAARTARDIAHGLAAAADGLARLVADL